MTSPIMRPINQNHNQNRNHRLRQALSPVNRASPCYLDLAAHRFHVLVKTDFSSAYSNMACAEQTANHLIQELGELITELDYERAVDQIRIIDTVNSIQFARVGVSWVPMIFPDDAGHSGSSVLH